MKFSAALLAGGFLLACCQCVVPAEEISGADLARRLGCFACHGEGRGFRARSLEGVGARLPGPQLQVLLSQPRQLYPGAKMPSYAYLPDAERRALLHYLEGLK